MIVCNQRIIIRVGFVSYDFKGYHKFGRISSVWEKDFGGNKGEQSKLSKDGPGLFGNAVKALHYRPAKRE